MGITTDSKETILLLLEEHLKNIRELISCLDFTEKDFKQQLQSEFRYFDNIKFNFKKNVPMAESHYNLLESKLPYYKKNNKYRFDLAERILDYNNHLIGEKEDIPF